MDLLAPLVAALHQRAERGLYRSRRVLESAQGVQLQLDGRELLSFCSNDYLGLAADPRLAEAAAKGLRRYGTGSGAAHLISGHSRAHHQLEEELAAFLGRQRALLFSTGYMANLGVLAALCGDGDLVCQDRLNHASLIDGARLSGARLRRYPHLDPGPLESWLQEPGRNTRLVATDGVFSMDGDRAPLRQLSAIAQRSGTWFMVDDAHGIGVIGATGAGCCEAEGLDEADVPILMGTLGKAIGTFGAFVAGPEALVETLIQHARSYIYTTAPPPAVAEAARVAVRICQAEPWRRERLSQLVRRFRREAAGIGLQLYQSETPIQPVLAGSSEQVLAWSAFLERKGILITPVRPPTVPLGSARLRITFSATHTDAQLERLLDALAAMLREFPAV